MVSPKWVTSNSFLGTVTERLTTSTAIIAAGDNIYYKIISGHLPGGLRFSTSTGIISGTPYSVGTVVRNQFVVRAYGTGGVTDKTFYIDTQGPTEPVWITNSGSLPVGIAGQFYTVNGQFVDYQLRAEYDILPPGQKLRYFIEDRDGQLPLGLRLTEDGRIVGQITDRLRIDYKSSGSGGFDLEPYDEYPYDHIGLVKSGVATAARFIAKTYQFIVSVTDGVAISKREFKIKVDDPSSLRADSGIIHADSLEYLSDSGAILSPQWLTPANLGVVRANNKQVINLSVYDFDSAFGTLYYDWDSPTINQDGSPSVHPPYFKLDRTTGALYASLPYQPDYSALYKFTIYVVKKIPGGEETATARTFTLTIRGDAENAVEFVTPTKVGTIAPGYQSELKIEAKNVGADFAIEYNLIDGSLPAGLSLLSDGTIVGRVEYNTETTFDLANYGFSAFKIDGGTTTIDHLHKFTVQASDIYKLGAVEKDFYIEIRQTDITPYTQIYVQPFLTQSQRSMYAEFLNDSYIFDRSLMYRVNDPAFGIQDKIKLTIEHGLQKLHLDDYYDGIRQYFDRKKFYFGAVKTTKALDAKGNYIYDIVYVDIIDTFKNTKGQDLIGSREVGNKTVYPNGVANMRNALESVLISGNPIKTDEYLMPRFMRTIQASTGSPLGFVLAAPICYTLPGKGDTIVKRINVRLNQGSFNFTDIDFDVDRLIVKDTLESPLAKYLLFPRKTTDGNILGESRSYFSENNLVWETEDGQPLYAE